MAQDGAGWASGYDYDVDRWVEVGGTVQLPMRDTPQVTVEDLT